MQLQQAERIVRITQIDASRFPLVTLYISVVDPAGNPVAGLTQGDFQIKEAGQPVLVSMFAGANSYQSSTVLVIDHSFSMADADKMNQAKKAARVFVDQMRPDDQTAVLSFSDAPTTLQPFTPDRAALYKAIGPLRPDGATALYDSLFAAVQLLQEAPTAHKTLIMLTDGHDLRSAADPRPASRHSLQEAIQIAQQAHIAVTVIGLGKPAADQSHDGIDETVLRQIANDTGGIYLAAPDPETLANLYQNLSLGIQNEYVLTYRSTLSATVTQRDIQVTLGSVDTSSYQLNPPPVLPEIHPTPAPILPVELLPFVAVPALVAGVLLWRHRRILAAERARRPIAATGATTMLEPPRFCVECGQPLYQGATRCETCGAPVALTPR